MIKCKYFTSKNISAKTPQNSTAYICVDNSSFLVCSGSAALAQQISLSVQMTPGDIEGPDHTAWMRRPVKASAA